MTKKQEAIKDWLLDRPGYLKCSPKIIARVCKIKSTSKDIEIGLQHARIDFKRLYKVIDNVVSVNDTSLVKPRKTHHLNKEIKNVNIIKSCWYDVDNVLFIPDLHAPFIKDGVLEFCQEQRDKYHAGTVIFAGDIVDGHAWSYHEHDPDGMSVGHEINAAKEQLKPWFEAFPNAISLMGNHDLLIQRKARTIGLSNQFIKGFGEVIGAPKTWEFKLEHTQDNVLYKHGNVGDAFKVAQQSRISTCQGHFHAKTFVQWSVSEKDAIFGMQVGWGADRHAYAFDYGKPFAAKPIISCGLVLENGTLPIVKLMKL